MNLTARYRIVYHSNVPTNRRCPDDVAASLLSVTLSPLCPQTLSPSHYLPGLCTLVLAPQPLWLARAGTSSLRKDFRAVEKFPDRPTTSDRAVFSFTLFLVFAFLSCISLFLLNFVSGYLRFVWNVFVDTISPKMFLYRHIEITDNHFDDDNCYTLHRTLSLITHLHLHIQFRP